MKPQKRSRPEAESKEDVEMSGDVAGRKIVKAKRKLEQKDEKILDEDGNELSFEDDDDSWEDAEGIDEQEVV